METITIERNAFNRRMQVLGFENSEINVIWNVMNISESNLPPKEDFNNAIEFLKLRHS